MKVLQILGSLCPAGIETWLARVQVPLKLMGVELDFACYYPEEEANAKFSLRETLESNGARVFSISRKNGIVNSLTSLSKILRANKYDIVHSHDWYSAYALPVACWHRIPGRVAQIHPVGDVDGARGFIRRIMLTTAKRFLWNTANGFLWLLVIWCGFDI